MAPSSTAAARRPAAAPQQRPSTRRPPLRIFEPEPRRSTRRRASRRAPIWLSIGLVVASLLIVVIGDAMVTQGQVRMADTQLAISAAQVRQKSMQVEVAQMAAPDRVVAEALALGKVAPSTVGDLPYTSLNVPLPAPQTSPVATAATPKTANAATTPAAATSPATTAR